jgi:hypothetical protein
VLVVKSVPKVFGRKSFFATMSVLVMVATTSVARVLMAVRVGVARNQQASASTNISVRPDACLLHLAIQMASGCTSLEFTGKVDLNAETLRQTDVFAGHVRERTSGEFRIYSHNES